MSIKGFIKKRKNQKKDRIIKDILLETKGDRRLFPNVPDKSQQRSNIDRRGQQRLDDLSSNNNINDFIKANEAGIRYKVSYDVEVICKNKGTKSKFLCQGIDISMTGILLQIRKKEDMQSLESADSIELNFEIVPGTMPEGMEMKVKISAYIVRTQIVSEDEILFGLQFKEELSIYSTRKKDRYMLMISSLLLFLLHLLLF